MSTEIQIQPVRQWVYEYIQGKKLEERKLERHVRFCIAPRKGSHKSFHLNAKSSTVNPAERRERRQTGEGKWAISGFRGEPEMRLRILAARRKMQGKGRALK